MTFLDRVAADRRRRVAADRLRVPREALQAACAGPAPGPRALERLAAWPPARRAIIAEVKRRSPSRGPLRPDLDPKALGRAYEAAGAYAVSVLVEPDHFGGSLGDLEAVRGAVGIPVLYKDFVADPYQVWEARAAGADLVLLIAALLGGRTGEYVALAREAGLEPLVEVHDQEDLALAVASGARLVGINNRNLRTLRVDLAASRELLPRIPPGVLAVSESGLTGAAEMDELADLGARAFLVGEVLVTAPDPGAALAALVERGPP